ncbi:MULTISPECIES: large exoprotein [Microbacterium]|uniref:Large exoprotein n=1 Tax=Microbacterium marmarense TaxID=3122051 RepID=A0ABU8LY03_9MICO
MNTTYYDYDDASGLLAFYLVLIPFLLILALAGYIIFSIFLMKIFEKAGVKGKWRAWVPVYNTMIFSKLGDLSPWLILIAAGAAIFLSWIPVIGQLFGLAAFLVTLLAAWRVGLKLQKEAVWLILYFFLSIVWYGINAFDKSRWNTAIPAAPWASNGFLSDKTVWDAVPSQVPAGGFPPNPTTTPGAYPPAAGNTPPAAPPVYQPPAAPAAPPAAAPTPPPAAPTPPPAAAPEPPAATEPPAAPEPPKA